MSETSEVIEGRVDKALDRCQIMRARLMAKAKTGKIVKVRKAVTSPPRPAAAAAANGRRAVRVS
jgi:hypothetical protein